MLRSLNDLRGYKLLATDGEIGHVDDFLFDDDSWTVRYLIADTGTWLPGRKVLLSPVALGLPDWESLLFPVSLTKDQIKKSPELNVHKPVSRAHEIELHDHYEWAPYWSTYGLGSARSTVHEVSEEGEDFEDESVEESHLRSLKELQGYHIKALDGQIGHVEDLVANDETWIIRYLVVDTKNWWPGKRVLISPEWTEEIAWDQSKVVVDLKKETIKSGLEYNPSSPVNREYEARLYDYYGRPKYWE